MVRQSAIYQNAFIPTYFQNVLLRNLVEEGIDPENLLSGLGLSRSQFAADECRISTTQNKRFINNVLTETQNPHLGWQFGQEIKITALGILGYAVMSSESVGSAVSKLVSFFQIREPSYDLRILDAPSAQGDRILQVDETYDFGEIRYFMLSCMVSAFDNVFRGVTHEESSIRKVELTCEQPEDWQSQAHKIEFPIVFGSSSNRLYLDSNFLKRTMPAADPHTEKTTKQICEQLLAASKSQSGIIKKVNDFILQRNKVYPSLAETAHHLCMSPRTLRRELQKSKTTYQQLLDAVRLNIAKELLLQTTKTTSEIAFELGYNDASNFSRAFRAWTGRSPGSYRK